MDSPIFLDNYGDLLVFESPDLAVRYVEPVDVRNGEYVGYDAKGRLLRLEVSATGRVLVSVAEQEPAHCEELRHTLIRFLTIVDRPRTSLDAVSLADLVERASRYMTK